MKLTPFGKAIRKLRIDHNLLLGEMANKLGVSSAYLSSIELGERAIPVDLLKKIKALAIFTSKELSIVEKSIHDSLKEFKFIPKTDHQRDLMASLARSFDNLTAEQIKRIQKTINQTGNNNE